MLGGGYVDTIWRDLRGGRIVMLVGSGRILRSVMDDTWRIGMGGGGDIMDVGASSRTTSHGWIR